MTVVVDTGILLDHLRERADATRTLERALRSGERVAGSVLTRTELRRGARHQDVAAIESLELLLDWVAVDHEIAALAAAHAERYGRSHPELGVVDLVIAATALRLDAQLLTRDVDRFPMFPGLRPPY